LLLQQNQMVQSAEGERQTYFLRQTQKVQSAEEERHTHTHTYIFAAAKQSLQSVEGERNYCLLLQQIKTSICGDQHSIAMKRARSFLPFGDWMKSCGATHLPSYRLQQQSDKICGLSPLPTSPSLLLPCSLFYFYSWKIWGSFSCFLLKATLELSFDIQDSYNLEVHREQKEQEWRRRQPKWQTQLGSLITLINTHFLHHQLLLLPSLAPLQPGRM